MCFDFFCVTEKSLTWAFSGIFLFKNKCLQLKPADRSRMFQHTRIVAGALAQQTDAVEAFSFLSHPCQLSGSRHPSAKSPFPLSLNAMVPAVQLRCLRKSVGIRRFPGSERQFYSEPDCFPVPASARTLSFLAEIPAWSIGRSITGAASSARGELLGQRWVVRTSQNLFFVRPRPSGMPIATTAYSCPNSSGAPV